MNLKTLHHLGAPLLLANVWDVNSALIAKEMGYKAIGTSSAAISSMLGYQDGEGMNFEELYFIVSQIKNSVDLPLSVDLEFGYGDSLEQIINNIKRLEVLGIAGINFEDSFLSDGVRFLNSLDIFVDKISEISKACPDIFLNIRTDTFLLNVENTLQETLYRGNLYKKHGADGLFVPCVTSNNDIVSIVCEVDLPLNVMCMPNLANFETLSSLGVSRISMGDSVYSSLQNNYRDMLRKIKLEGSFSGIFNNENN